MNAIKIFAIAVVWFLLLYAVFSFCYFNLDASTWETADRVFMSFLWFTLSFASATYFTGVGK